MPLKQCHLCGNFQCFLAKCSKPRCKHSFCQSCITNQFNANFQMEHYKPDCWVCFVCIKSCKCYLCNGQFYQKKKKERKQIQTLSKIKVQMSSITNIKQDSGQDFDIQSKTITKAKIINKHLIRRQIILNFFQKNQLNKNNTT